MGRGGGHLPPRVWGSDDIKTVSTKQPVLAPVITPPTNYRNHTVKITQDRLAAKFMGCFCLHSTLLLRNIGYGLLKTPQEVMKLTQEVTGGI